MTNNLENAEPKELLIIKPETDLEKALQLKLGKALYMLGLSVEQIQEYSENDLVIGSNGQSVSIEEIEKYLNF